MDFNASDYLAVIDALLSGGIAAEEFDDAFRDLWRRDVHRQHAETSSDERRAEEEAFAMYDKGLISASELAAALDQFHGDDPKDVETERALNALHSTCSSFTRDPQLLAKGTYVHEAELRAHAERVAALLRVRTK